MRLKWIGLLALPLVLGVPAGICQRLALPPRAPDAPAGSAFAQSLATLDRPQREEKILEQIARGNVPDFLRRLSPVSAQSVQDGRTNNAIYYVTPDYLAVGTDDDYFLTPLTPITAQRAADLAQASLPTKKMVDQIYAQAAVKLVPEPIPPTAAMITVPVFIRHNSLVREQRRKQEPEHPPGELVAGDKKDIVLSKKAGADSGKVAIYGWHQPGGKAIQPLYAGHAETWADYSHGVRLVQLAMQVNGHATTLPEVLADPNLAGLLSDEGVLTNARYATNFIVADRPSSPPAITNVLLSPTGRDFKAGPFGERVMAWDILPDVKVFMDAPEHLDSAKPLKLVFFALPNGNTIAQTIGHKLRPGDDWHFDIQHIGAQTRFLRETLKDDCGIVVVYLESAQKSWPAWRAQHGNSADLIPQTVAAIRGVFKDYGTRITLSGHSGGGSWMIGYLNGVTNIPNEVERIAFLDADYAYDAKLGHAEKLMNWLRATDTHYLSVLAYHDDVALLDGKTFVSAKGGTWGRTHAMLEDMAALNFTTTRPPDKPDLEIRSALAGRVRILLLENPEKKILHTVQVEKNGFIQSLLSGTPAEGRNYEYFGPRAYAQWVQEAE